MAGWIGYPIKAAADSPPRVKLSDKLISCHCALTCGARKVNRDSKQGLCPVGNKKELRIPLYS
jgi:hypothetical protein